jgi:cation transport ATPase
MPLNRSAVNELIRMGIPVVIASGDHPDSVTSTGALLGIRPDNCFGGLTAQRKVDLIKSLGGNVAFVGDGVNDVQAISEANVGISVGSAVEISLQVYVGMNALPHLGSIREYLLIFLFMFVQSSDAVLTNCHLNEVPGLIKLARKVVTRMRFNVLSSLVYNAIAIPVAAGAFYPRFVLSSSVCALLMSLSSITVIVASLGLLIDDK